MQIFRRKLFFFNPLLCALALVPCIEAGADGVSSPSMPTISSPTIGGKYYMPGSSSYYFTGRMNPGEARKVDERAVMEGEAKDAAAKKGSVASTLTAKDMNALSTLGFLGSLDSNSSSVLRGFGTLSPEGNSSEIKDILDRVLREIESIKRENKETILSVVKADSADTSENIVRASKTEAVNPRLSRILRFNVNDYDILKTCRKIYISDVQANGTFLVTGDRKYVSDGKNRTETFHMLFRTAPNNDGLSNYNAAASVTQDYENRYSFLYQLAKRKNLSAMRTGNLLSMRTDDSDWKLELLIDLGEDKENDE